MPWIQTRKPKDVTNDFIELYCKYIEDLTDAPIEYHEPVALFMLASVLDRKMYMRFKQGFRYPNVWILILGDSTLSRKSTCQNIARKIMQEVSNKTHIFQLAEDSTPEGLIDSLSIEPRGYWMRDEVSGFFALLRKDYMTGMKELLILIFDCLDHYEKHLTKKHYVLDGIYTNFLAGTTPKSFQDNIASEDFYTGFLARWLVFEGEFDPKRWKGLEKYTEEDKLTHNILVNSLVYIHNMFTRIVECEMDDNTLDYYNKWSYDNQMELLHHDMRSEIAPFYGRIEEYVVKISMLYEVSNVTRLQSQLESDRGYIKVHKDSLLKAIKFIEHYKKERLPMLMSKVNSSGTTKIQKIIEEAGKSGIQHSYLLRKSHMSAAKIKGCISTLEESENVVVTISREGRKKRKTYYSSEYAPQVAVVEVKKDE